MTSLISFYEKQKQNQQVSETKVFLRYRLSNEEKRYLKSIKLSKKLSEAQKEEIRKEFSSFALEIASEFYGDFIPVEVKKAIEAEISTFPPASTVYQLVSVVLRVISNYEHVSCPLDESRLLKIQNRYFCF